MKKLILLFIFLTFSAVYAQNPPDPPSNLKAEIDQWMGMKGITLTWSSVTGRDIYFTVYRKANDENEFTKFPVRMHGLMFKDKFVLPDRTYEYYVTASNQFGESQPSDTVSVDLNDNTPDAYIYGNITDDETGDPLQAMVDIIPVSGWSFRHVKTDFSGNYLSKVNIGDYYIGFMSRGYYPELFENARSIFEATKITLSENDSINISAGLRAYFRNPEFLISGTVKNQSGEPLKARVQLVIFNRGRMDHLFRGAVTDSLGNYHLPVAQGDSVAVFAVPMDKNYLPEFYNDKKDFTEADRFVVTGNTGNIDFVLEERPVYHNSIAGLVTNEAGEGLAAAVTAFKLRENNSRRFSRTVVTDTLGNYKFENLIPGYYILLAVPINTYLPSFFNYDGTQTFRWREADSVIVGENTQLTGIDFNLLPVPDSGYARITGLIKDKAGNGVNGAIVYVTNENSQVSAYSTTDADGAFTIDNLAPGNYKVSTVKFNYENPVEQSVTLNYTGSIQQNVVMTLSPSTTTSLNTETPVIRNYELFQNYPNPFNPVTTIKYQMPAAGMVSLKIYNLIGQEIITLVDGNKPAGEHTVKFDASGLNSGIYFYKLNAGNKVFTRKMIVLK